jgi:uncharacterized cofD-like protein
MAKSIKKIVLIGGGVGASTFTKALQKLPIKLTTVVSSFDNGGSTGKIRQDYHGIAIGDFRQCLLANLSLKKDVLSALNHRYGPGHLHHVQTANVLLKAFFDSFPDPASGVDKLHELLGLSNNVAPISFTDSEICARLSNRQILRGEHAIALYQQKNNAEFVELFLKPKAVLNPVVKQAMANADYIIIAPGNFFASILPSLCVEEMKQVWQKSHAKKLWFVNLLAHNGHDNKYQVVDYLKWFTKYLGNDPFDALVFNKSIPQVFIKQLKKDFSVIAPRTDELKVLKSTMEISFANLISPTMRVQNSHDLIKRAPLRHDEKKIEKYFKKMLYE